ncbi:MAG: RluA family pseudouridine synthase [Planctomycetota bacterium]
MKDPAKPGDLLYTVDPHWKGLRLDHFLKAMLPAMSRSKIQRLAKSHRIFVNDEPRRSNWKVQVDDRVRLVVDDPTDDPEAGQSIPIDLIYEDEDLLVINKAAGLQAHPVAGHRFDTLLNAIYWRWKDDIHDSESISLANRLDKDTSGVIVAAKHKAARQKLQRQFESRTPTKSYLAIAAGHIEHDQGLIEFALAGNPIPRARDKIIVSPDGKPSSTSYEVKRRGCCTVGEAPSLDWTYLALFPETGRQHQLRVHLAAIGHALLGDDRYGPELLQASAPHRCALHAHRLTLQHPGRGDNVTFEAPLAADLTRYLET